MSEIPESVQVEPLLLLSQRWLGSVLAELPMKVCVDLWGQREVCTPGTLSRCEQALRVSVHEPGLLKRLFLSRDPLVLVEGYLEGGLRFAGRVEQMLALLEYLSERKGCRQDVKQWVESDVLSQLRSLIDKVALWQRSVKHSPERDKAAVQQHYDLSNDFYKLWLDDLMVYSCAHFEDPHMSLDKAQESKLDLICRKLRLRPGEKLLDIGCGWGGLLRWAALRYGAKAVGISLSNEQVRHNRSWIKQDGLEDMVQVELCDYREAHKLGTFDKIVSVGMIEHVGLKKYAIYFSSILKELNSGGLFLNHGITTNSEWRTFGMAERFIDRYIFPDGELSTLPATLAAAKDAGWEVTDVDCWRPHYAKTLRCWAQRLERARDEATKIVGDRVVRLWQLYLIGCAFGFERNKLSVYQTLMRPAREQNWNLPMTRAGWLS